MNLLGKGLGSFKGLKLFSKFSAAPVTLVVSFGTEYLKIGYGRGSQGKFTIEGVAVESIEKNLNRLFSFWSAIESSSR